MASYFMMFGFSSLSYSFEMTDYKKTYWVLISIGRAVAICSWGRRFESKHGLVNFSPHKNTRDRWPFIIGSKLMILSDEYSALTATKSPLILNSPRSLSTSSTVPHSVKKMCGRLKMELTFELGFQDTNSCGHTLRFPLFIFIYTLNSWIVECRLYPVLWLVTVWYFKNITIDIGASVRLILVLNIVSWNVLVSYVRYYCRYRTQTCKTAVLRLRYTRL